MESRVKDTHLRDVGQETRDSVDALQIGRVVERGKVRECFKGIKHLFVEKHGLTETLAAMHHAVTYGIQFAQRLQYTVVGTRQHVKDELHAGGMLRNLLLQRYLLPIRKFQLEERVFLTYLLNAALCQDGLVAHVEQLVFDGTASAVKNQYFHVFNLLLSIHLSSLFTIHSFAA